MQKCRGRRDVMGHLARFVVDGDDDGEIHGMLRRYTRRNLAACGKISATNASPPYRCNLINHSSSCGENSGSIGSAPLSMTINPAMSASQNSHEASDPPQQVGDVQ